MEKIADTNELVMELQRLLTAAQSTNPSREKLAGSIRQLAERVAGPGRGSVVDQLKLEFPWSAGDTAEKDLEKQYDLLERYMDRVKQVMREQRRNTHRKPREEVTVEEHFKLLDEAQSALLSVKVRLSRANTALYH